MCDAKQQNINYTCACACACAERMREWRACAATREGQWPIGLLMPIIYLCYAAAARFVLNCFVTALRCRPWWCGLRARVFVSLYSVNISTYFCLSVYKLFASILLHHAYSFADARAHYYPRYANNNKNKHQSLLRCWAANHLFSIGHLLCAHFQICICNSIGFDPI